MPISPDEIAGKRFVVTLRGYDRAEVDSYLRALAADQTRLLERIKELEAAAGRAPVAGGPEDPGTILDQAIDALTGLRRSLGDGLPAAPATGRAAKARPAPKPAARKAPTRAAKESPTPAKSTKARPAPAKSTKARPAPAKSTKANPAPVKTTKAASGRTRSAQGPHEATARTSRSAG